MELPRNLGTRVGILGGTFDPVHNGHLAVAEAVHQALALSNILFVPAFLPPHKPTYTISPFVHRAAMLELAVANTPGFSVSRLEAERVGPSYSIDTLRTLAQSLGNQVHLFFIIGMDAFAEIHTWKAYRELLNYASFVVIGRPDHCQQSCGQTVAANFPGYTLNEAQGFWQGESGQGGIHPVAMAPVKVSSTEIREAVRQGKEIGTLVPSAVADYIAAQGLYR
ncbi:nicotinate-nucleotide adenylyltransferase [Thiovibrio frasassiensis]|uniref:Probable nicotinate-nucleotide adenylyltransferase n=1 Tax=Thiovibrio frasassiensis TaxID=2984131 RepID=A0A9X4MIH7_9BACT|nr:nicotinate-nucleotide adenylyltransferase [Thiovibrio frasassiensis]MDG4476988.1 nicotinate-nucleotide adenylyltransferase [Thiovibrio frasassiensis]